MKRLGKRAGVLFCILALIFALIFYMEKPAAEQRDALTAEEDLTLGIRFFREGKYEEAAALLNKVIEVKPYLGEALLAAGEAHREMGEYALAADYFEKALELNPMDTETWNKLENSLIFTGESERMKEMYQKSLCLFPSRSSHLDKLIHLCIAEGDWEFLRKLSEELEGSPLQPSVEYGYRACVLLKEGKMEEAENLLFRPEAVAEIKKSNTYLYFGGYNGEGEPHGMGVCFYSGNEKETDIFIGEWEDGRREGAGKAFSSNLRYGEEAEGIDYRVVFEGDFKDDLPEGEGIMTRSYRNGSEVVISVIKAEFCAGYAQGQVIMEQYQNSGISLKQEHQVKSGIPQRFMVEENDISENVYEAVYSGEELLGYSNLPCNCVFKWN